MGADLTGLIGLTALLPGAASGGAYDPNVGENQWLIDTNEWGEAIDEEWSILNGAEVWSMEVDSQDAGRMALVAELAGAGDNMLEWPRATSGLDLELAYELHLRYRILTYNGQTYQVGAVGEAIASPNVAYLGGRAWWHGSEQYRMGVTQIREDGSGSNANSANVFTSRQAASAVFNFRVQTDADPGDSTGREGRARMWLDSEAEPGTWQVTDSSAWDFQTGGSVAFLAQLAGKYEFLTLGIGLDGAAAPAPS